MPRLGVIELSQLPPFVVLETISTETILSARMASLVQYWSQNDPPNAAQYDVGNLEFDPIRINQECSTFFELMLRDRVNQAARAVTLAFGFGGNLDAIGSRYPGGMPRLAGETDGAYKTRIWLSPNTLSQNGLYETYIFYALTAAQAAGTPLRDCQVLATPGQPNVAITIMNDGAPITALQDATGTFTGAFSAFPSPIPTNAQVTSVDSYIKAPGQGRKGLTDVVSVGGPLVVNVDYRIGIWLYPGWDVSSIMQQLFQALAALLESQRYLGFSHTLAAIDGALKVSGVYNVDIANPTKDVVIPTNAVVRVNSVALTYSGRAGFGPLPPTA